MADYYVKCEFPIITAITQANPGAVTTESAHGLTTGDLIGISGVAGMTQVNNVKFTVTVTSSTTFTLGVDTTGYTAYVGAGFVHPGPGSGTYRGPWLASTAFALGDRAISNTVSSRRIHECTTAGTSGATQPVFNTGLGGSTTDNTVTWTTRDPTTWANSTISLSRALQSIGADSVYVSQNSNEVYAANVTLGVLDNTLVVCADDSSGTPPTSTAVTARIRVIGNFNLNLAGDSGARQSYWYGMIFEAGEGGSSNGQIFTAYRANGHVWDNCKFRILGSSTGARANFSATNTNNPAFRTLNNCSFKFANTSQGISIAQGYNFEWNGGSLESGSAAVTTLFTVSNNSCQAFVVSGVDLSNCASSMVLFSSTTAIQGAIVRNCEMPASWTGSLYTGTPATRLSLFNCDDADTNYKIEVKDPSGSLLDDTGIYNNAGATDGTTRLSWKTVTTSTARYLVRPFSTPEIVRWNETTGSSITVTVETLTDNVTLKDDECWLEVMYLGTSGYPLGTWISDAKASPVATAANQPTSSATWTTTGITTPVKQYLSVSFTPQEKGFIHARVCVGKASTTVYVDPKLTVS